MKIIIAGGRDFGDYEFAYDVLSSFRTRFGPSMEVVSGHAKGADQLGEMWADEYRLKVTLFHADWDKHGKAAGPIRNAAMALYADVLVVFWDGKSKGTLSMITLALDAGLEIHVYRYFA